MSFESLFFWMSFILCFELFLVKSAVYLMSILLLLILVLIFFLFWVEFDILASLILGVYSSVFIVFFLLLLHFATFWALATKHELSKNVSTFGLIGVIFFVVFFFGGGSYWVEGYSFFNYLWQDFFFLGGLTSSMTVQMLHYFFFRFFIFETMLLNFYLLFSLVLALGLLGLSKLYAGLKFSTKTLGLNSHNRELVVGVPTRQTSALRTRQVSKFSRQTSSQNSSIMSYR